MLGQVDAKTIGANLFLIIGALICLAVTALFAVAAWVAINVWLSGRRERRSWEDYQRSTRRADGRPYPPFIEGVCDLCGRGDRKIYQAEWGQALCPPCYESAWPQRTARGEQLAEQARLRDHDRNCENSHGAGE